jgi:hypothetical protein
MGANQGRASRGSASGTRGPANYRTATEDYRPGAVGGLSGPIGLGIPR